MVDVEVAAGVVDDEAGSRTLIETSRLPFGMADTDAAALSFGLRLIEIAEWTDVDAMPARFSENGVWG